MRPRVTRLTGIYVYRLYDEAGRPIYFGCTLNLRRRLGEHRRSASWWPLVADMKFTGPFVDAPSARRHESRAIMAEGPRFNEVHHPRRDLSPVERTMREATA